MALVLVFVVRPVSGFLSLGLWRRRSEYRQDEGARRRWSRPSSACGASARSTTWRTPRGCTPFPRRWLWAVAAVSVTLSVFVHRTHIDRAAPRAQAGAAHHLNRPSIAPIGVCLDHGRCDGWCSGRCSAMRTGTSATVWVEAELGRARSRVLGADGVRPRTVERQPTYALVIIGGQRTGPTALRPSTRWRDGLPAPLEGPASLRARSAPSSPGAPADPSPAYGSSAGRAAPRGGATDHGVPGRAAYPRARHRSRTLRSPDASIPRGPGVRGRDVRAMRSTWLRRELTRAAGREIKDYEEYAHLYRLAWTIREPVAAVHGPELHDLR